MYVAFVRSTIPLFPLAPKITAKTLQGAYWGTAYAAYSLIYTPGYGVHTWNLHNKDLIKPLYVCFTLGYIKSPLTLLAYSRLWL